MCASRGPRTRSPSPRQILPPKAHASSVVRAQHDARRDGGHHRRDRRRRLHRLDTHLRSTAARRRPKRCSPSPPRRSTASRASASADRLPPAASGCGTIRPAARMSASPTRATKRSRCCPNTITPARRCSPMRSLPRRRSSDLLDSADRRHHHGRPRHDRRGDARPADRVDREGRRADPLCRSAPRRAGRRADARRAAPDLALARLVAVVGDAAAHRRLPGHPRPSSAFRDRPTPPCASRCWPSLPSELDSLTWAQARRRHAAGDRAPHGPGRADPVPRHRRSRTGPTCPTPAPSLRCCAARSFPAASAPARQRSAPKAR